MKIYKLGVDVDRYDQLRLIEWIRDDNVNDSIDFMHTFDGTSKKIDTWKPLRVKRLHPELPLGDNPYCFTSTVFSQRAVDILYPLIKNEAEILPLVFDEKSYIF